MTVEINTYPDAAVYGAAPNPYIGVPADDIQDDGAEPEPDSVVEA